MRWIQVLMLCVISLSAVADVSREQLLLAWEEHQKSNPDILQFKKLGKDLYHIKFAHMPYDGELKLLAYNTELLDYLPDINPYTHTGYVEIDLTAAPAEEINKYSRSYSRWLQSNTFYYNRESQSWDSWSVYRQQLDQQSEDLISDTSGILKVFDYWEYILLAVFLYFVVVTINNDRRVKRSLALQDRAMEDLEVNKRLIKEELDLHQETNRLLGEMLSLLKQQSGGKNGG
ncbi:MAG: hypothetical protein MI756_01885 [Chromatiales bacterium]|nr:hypothetical protein [Chromatiales bacterium]